MPPSPPPPPMPPNPPKSMLPRNPPATPPIMLRRNPPDWGGGPWAGVAPGVGVAVDDVDGDVDVDDGVDGWEGRVGVDMLRDPRLPEERLPPIRANASTVMNRNTAVETQTAATTNDRFLMVPPGSDANRSKVSRGAQPRQPVRSPDPPITIRKHPQGAGRQIPCKRRAKDERSGSA